MKVQLSMPEWEEIKSLLILLFQKRDIDMLTDEEETQLEKRMGDALNGMGEVPRA